jgi:hypothetical protein
MRLALACLLACLAFTAQAQSNGVYKWKDARGVTHYSDTPPRDGRYGNVAPDASARVAAPAKVDPRCATARANVERIRNSPGEVGPDANGDGKPDTVLDSTQRASQLQAAEGQVQRFCTPAAP